MKQADKNFYIYVYDTLMKNTQHKVRDFTKYTSSCRYGTRLYKNR